MWVDTLDRFFHQSPILLSYSQPERGNVGHHRAYSLQCCVCMSACRVQTVSPWDFLVDLSSWVCVELTLYLASTNILCSGWLFVSLLFIHLGSTSVVGLLNFGFSLCMCLCHQRHRGYFGRRKKCLFKLGPVEDLVVNSSKLLKALYSQPSWVSDERMLSLLLDQVLRMQCASLS